MKKDWTYKKLGEVCEKARNIQWNRVDEESYYYVDLTSVDRDSLSIVEPQIITKKDAPSRAKQIILKGDVLFGTTRPMLKRLCIVPELYDKQICSTGFCVLRPKKNVFSKWIFYAIHAEHFYSYVGPLQVGANYPAVTDGNVRNYQIPLPSLSEQQQIVAELDLLSGMIDKQKVQIEELDKLAQSIFYDMFGDPVTNEKGWEIKKMQEIASSKIGLTYKPADVVEDGTVVLRSGNIQENAIDLHDIVRVSTPIKDGLWVEDGDILMCTRNGSFRLVGKVAMIKDLPERMTYGAFMTIIRSKYNHYLFAYFKTPAFRAQLGCAGTATINQITVKMLNEISVPVPPLSLQQEFAAKIEAIEAMKAKVRQSLIESETLFNSRMDYYFN